MGLYTLVASRYDRGSGRYIKEVPIPLEGGLAHKLTEIDAYTSCSNQLFLLSELREKCLITDQDILSIRYTKGENAMASYYRVIYDHPKLQTCFPSLSKKSYYENGRFKVVDVIRYDNEYFKEEWAKLKQYLHQQRREEINCLYKKKNRFLQLFNNYLDSDYDNELEKERDLEKIKAELSAYKTFREWLVRTSQHPSIKRTYIPKKAELENRKRNPMTIEEAESMYQSQFEHKIGMSYHQYLATCYNQQYLADDKEEFLNEEEMEQVYGKRR